MVRLLRYSLIVTFTLVEMKLVLSVGKDLDLFYTMNSRNEIHLRLTSEMN